MDLTKFKDDTKALNKLYKKSIKELDEAFAGKRAWSDVTKNAVPSPHFLALWMARQHTAACKHYRKHRKCF